MSSFYFNNMVKCFDCLTDFVQGPCRNNQLLLINGKFFEIAKEILDNFREEKKKRKQKHRMIDVLDENNFQECKDSLQPWMIAKLKYKVFIS